MVDACTPARPIHNGLHKGGAAFGRPPLCGSLCGWVWQVFKHQASSIKHQASSIKHQASSSKQQAASSKQQALRNWALDSGKKLRNLSFSDSQFLMRGFLLGRGGCTLKNVLKETGRNVAGTFLLLHLLTHPTPPHPSPAFLDI